MFALNFYPEYYSTMLMSGIKTATIRLGDKSKKYQSGQIVWVTCGRKYRVRQKLFTAVIDDVTVKPIEELTCRELQKENSAFRNIEDIINIMTRIYSREIVKEDTVTIISFSPIIEESSR